MLRPCTCLRGNIPQSFTKFSTRYFTAQLSTLQRGTLFEERSQKLLQDHLSMSLKRVGGKEDGGIDLMGWWWLPESDLPSMNDSRTRRIRILAQCKAEKKKMGPNYVREMEGVLHRFLANSKLGFANEESKLDPFDNCTTQSQFPLVAILISESPFTKSTHLRAQSSPIPFLLIHIPPFPDDSSTGPNPSDQLGSAVWNPALAGVQGLLRGQMEVRWERCKNNGGRPGLWWKNRKLRSWTPETSSEET